MYGRFEDGYKGWIPSEMSEMLMLIRGVKRKGKRRTDTIHRKLYKPEEVEELVHKVQCIIQNEQVRMKEEDEVQMIALTDIRGGCCETCPFAHSIKTLAREELCNVDDEEFRKRVIKLCSKWEHITYHNKFFLDNITFELKCHRDNINTNQAMRNYLLFTINGYINDEIVAEENASTRPYVFNRWHTIPRDLPHQVSCKGKDLKHCEKVMKFLLENRNNMTEVEREYFNNFDKNVCSGVYTRVQVLYVYDKYKVDIYYGKEAQRKYRELEEQLSDEYDYYTPIYKAYAKNKSSEEALSFKEWLKATERVRALSR